MKNNQNYRPPERVKLFVALILAGQMLLNCPLSGAVSKNPLSDEQIDKRIREYRTAEVSLTVTDAMGNRLANSAVTVRQVRHKFLFGCNGFRINPDKQTEYNRQFAEVFNYATLPFYWGYYEGVGGKTNAENVTRKAQWCRKHSISPKGHPLVWHRIVPGWVNKLDIDKVKQAQFHRLVREIETFASLIDTWDVVNEAVVMPNYHPDTNPVSKLCNKIGQVEFVRQAFDNARRANPKAQLILNDYNTTQKNEKLIEQCLDAGVDIDVIGLQSHMHHGYWPKKKIWDICQRFAKFGKPIHFTELTILSGKLMRNNDWGTRRKDWNSTAQGEKRQARQVVELYRLLFSHPSVQAITWWDFADNNAWMGAPAGFLRKDMSPKPAYDALKKLIKEQWWTDYLKLKTDSAGRISFRGFLGDYVIECEKGKAEFSIDKARKVNKTVSIN